MLPKEATGSSEAQAQCGGYRGAEEKYSEVLLDHCEILLE